PGGGALAMSAGGMGMLAALAKRIPALGALLLVDDIMTGVKGGDSYSGSLEGGQAALDGLKVKLDELSAAFNELKTAMGGVADIDFSTWNFTEFVNDEIVKFVRDLTNIFNDLAAAIRAVSGLLGTKNLEEAQARGDRINSTLEPYTPRGLLDRWLGGGGKGDRVG